MPLYDNLDNILRDLSYQYSGPNSDIQLSSQQRLQMALELAKQQEEEQKKRNLLDFINKLNTQGTTRQPDLSPEEQQIGNYYNTRPEEKQAFLRNYEKQVQEKADQGGTFTNEDLKPYLIAGIQSQAPQTMDVNTPEGMSNAYAQGINQGVPEGQLKTALALSQKEQPKPDEWIDWGIGQKMNPRTGQIAIVPTKEVGNQKEISGLVESYQKAMAEIDKQYPSIPGKPDIPGKADAINRVNSLYEPLLNQYGWTLNAKGQGNQQSSAVSPPIQTGKKLDEATARMILQEAGGDKQKARQIAVARGYEF